MTFPAEAAAHDRDDDSRRGERASTPGGAPAPQAPEPDRGRHAPAANDSDAAVLHVSLFASHPLMLERMRIQLRRPELCIHGYMLPVRERSGPIEPLHQGIWVLDLHDPALLEQVVRRRDPPWPPWLAVDDHFEDVQAFRLLTLGARGLVAYERIASELVRAVHAVQAGAYWVPRMLMARFVQHLLARLPHPAMITPLVNLSRRERQVFDGILARHSNKEIAAHLHVSERTVKFHVSNLLIKFGATSRHDLAWSLMIQPRS